MRELPRSPCRWPRFGRGTGGGIKSPSMILDVEKIEGGDPGRVAPVLSTRLVGGKPGVTTLMYVIKHRLQ
jgi:hypothetical protein